ncbi:MAG: DUF4340 domain-containing protein [Pseudomonadota bacterium]|nr:DUF4340 domain-containing protein [Pseudomonadota bacterium]
MRKAIVVLTGVFVLQILLVAGFSWRESGSRDTPAAATPLLELSTDAIDGIRIEGEGQTALLRKSENGWKLPDYHGLPVDESKRTGLIDQLSTIELTWPVTTTAGSVDRFEVGNDNFQRRLVFLQGDTVLQELFLGTSPGFRQVHARKAGQDAVYAIEFSNFQATSDPKDWFDKGLLQPTGEITRIAGDGFVLRRQDTSWTLEGAEPEQEIDTDTANQLRNRLQNLRVIAPVENSSGLEHKQPVFSLTLSGAEADTRYDFYQQNERYIVHASPHPGYFEIADYVTEALMKIDRDSLLTTAGTTATPDERSQPVKTGEQTMP